MLGKHIFFAVFFLFFFLASSQVMAVTINYSYDNNGRLTEAVYSTTRISYQYDLNSNLLLYNINASFFWPMFLPAINYESNQVAPTMMTDKDGSMSPSAHSGSSK